MVSILPEPSELNANTTSVASIQNRNEVLSVPTLADDNTLRTAVADNNIKDAVFEDHTQHQTGLVFKDSISNSSNFFAAIKQGQLDKVKELLQTENGLVASSGMWSSTPLIIACQYNHKDIALLLAEHSSDALLNHQNEKGATALLYCCLEKEMVEVAQYLMVRKVFIHKDPSVIYNSMFDKSMSLCCLSASIMNNNIEALVLLLNHLSNAEIDLPFACPFGKGILTVSGVPNVPPTSTTGAMSLTPLMLCCAYGRVEMMDLLLARIQTSSKEDNSIHKAIEGNIFPITTTVVDTLDDDPMMNVIHKYSVLAALDKIDEFGCSVFHHICKSICNDDTIVLQMLTKLVNTVLSLKLDSNSINAYNILSNYINYIDMYGNSPLHYLCDNKYTQSIQYLISLIDLNTNKPLCDVNIQNNNGITALYIAIKKRCELAVVELVQYSPTTKIESESSVTKTTMIRKPADPNLCDVKGVSSIDLAMKLRTDSIIYIAITNLLKEKVVMEPENDVNNTIVNKNQETTELILTDMNTSLPDVHPSQKVVVDVLGSNHTMLQPHTPPPRNKPFQRNNPKQEVHSILTLDSNVRSDTNVLVLDDY